MDHILWVSAHPDRHSLTAALRAEGIGHLRKQGYEVTESDLYAMRWNHLLGDDELAAGTSPLADRQKSAALCGALGPDVRAEQDKLRRADTVVIQFPLWWYGMPAVLKGWFDRVFASGFAFDGSASTAAGATPAQRRIAAVAFAFSSSTSPETFAPWLPPGTV